jgi:hypothetical protein
MAFTNTAHLFTNTQPIDREEAAAAMTALYLHCGEPAPDIIFVNGPTELTEKLTPDLKAYSFFDKEPIAHFVNKRGSSWHDRLKQIVKGCFYYTPSQVQGSGGLLVGSTPLYVPEDFKYGYSVPKNPEYDNFYSLATAVWNNSYMTFNCKGVSFIVERPSEVHTNEERGFHRTDGPAIVFRDGTEVFVYEGVRVKKEHLLDPKSMTLEEIHRSRGHKHILIDMVGVDHYRSLCDSWKPPATKDRFKNFFGFHEMVIEGEDPTLRVWDKTSKGWMYKDRAYEVVLTTASVNKVRGLFIYHTTYSDSYYHFADHPFECEAGKELFDPEDRELWDSINFYKGMTLAGVPSVIVGFKDGIFYARTKLYEDGSGRQYNRNCVPHWFRAKMLRNEDVEYVCDDYKVLFKDEKLFTDSINPSVKINGSIFGGNQNVPHVFDSFNLESDSWEGLLEKWAKFSFEWLGMFQ